MYSKQFRSVHFRYQRGANTVKKIRKAFIEEVFLQGLHKVRICDLTRRAKVTRGAFYNYWSSLQECLADIMLIREGLEEENTQAEMWLGAGSEVRSLLVYKIREFLSIKSNKDLQVHYFPLVLLQEKNFLNAELSGLLRSCLKHIRMEWNKIIQRDQERGLICSTIERETSVVCILNFMSGIIQNMNHDSESEELNRPLKATMSHFVCSLLTEDYLNSHYSSKAGTLLAKSNASVKQQASLMNKKAKAKEISVRGA